MVKRSMGFHVTYGNYQQIPPQNSTTRHCFLEQCMWPTDRRSLRKMWTACSWRWRKTARNEPNLAKQARTEQQCYVMLSGVIYFYWTDKSHGRYATRFQSNRWRNEKGAHEFCGNSTLWRRWKKQTLRADSMCFLDAELKLLVLFRRKIVIALVSGIWLCSTFRFHPLCGMHIPLCTHSVSVAPCRCIETACG